MRSSARWSPAYLAGASLVAIQVAMGLLYKVVQKGGSYTFSQSSAISISECLKMIIACGLFSLEWRKRQSSLVDHERTRSHKEDPEQQPLYSPLPRDSVDVGLEEVEEKTADSAMDLSLIARRHSCALRQFVEACKHEVSVEQAYGYAQLAMLYALLNNIVFVLYEVADPGTISLLKSGITLVTALVMLVCFNTTIARNQWLAILLQICGLVVTQYHPEFGTTYGAPTYLLIFSQTFLSAVAGVYNQGLNKGSKASLHAQNMVLYAAGTVINLIAYLLMRSCKPGEPAFFSGYGGWGPVSIILSNVLIGLAVTAVYKHADAVIKCFATSISTGVLLYLSPILFNTSFGFLTVPGTLVVFIATWLYLEANPPKPYRPSPAQPAAAPTLWAASTARLHLPSSIIETGVFDAVMLAIKLCATVFIIVSLSSRYAGPSKAEGTKVTAPVPSPFIDTLAFVRWNSPHTERVPLINEYGPFFSDLHLSIPSENQSHTLTEDGFKDTYHIYKSVADAMQIAHDEREDIEGILYFHFDAWINPLAFSDLTKDHIYLAHGGIPAFRCMKSTDDVAWWGWQNYYHDAAKAAARAVKTRDARYEVDVEEWCVGWSDIYFMPRRFFEDYVFLANVFYEHGVFHEVAVPTILTIIDRTRSSHPNAPVLDLRSDCWGHCCAENPTVLDIQQHRCGHRLNFEDAPTTKAHFDALKEEQALLENPSHASLWRPRHDWSPADTGEVRA